MTEPSKGLLFAFTTAFMWGILPFLLTPLFQHAQVISIIWFRFTASFLLLMGWLRWQGALDLKGLRHLHWSVWLAGVCLSLNYYGFSYGLSLTNAASAQILIQSGPIFFAVLSLFVFRERLKRMQWLGVLLALLGFAIFWKDQVKHFLEAIARYNAGLLWIAIGGVSWGIYAVLLKWANQRHPPQVVNLGIYLLSAITYAPLVRYSDFGQAGPGTYALLISTSLNTIVAYGCLSEAVKRLSAAKVSLIICLNPLLTLFIIQCASVAGWSLAKREQLHLGSWIGAFFVIAGAVLVVRGREEVPVAVQD